MATLTRLTKSLSLDPVLLEEIQKTKGKVSTSERVNQLLRIALRAEKQNLLQIKAASFFSCDPAPPHESPDLSTLRLCL